MAAAALGPASARAAAPDLKVMIIRHAEKPADGGGPPGLSADGRPDRHALVIRGWERAGALVRFFAPPDGRFADPALARPEAVVAAAPSPEHPSARSALTVGPLAEALGLPLDLRFGTGREADAAAAVAARGGTVLIAWEHKAIARLVTGLTGGAIVPPHWPGARFDMVLVLDRRGGAWRLAQVPQLLLAGDDAAPLPAAKDGRDPE